MRLVVVTSDPPPSPRKVKGAKRNLKEQERGHSLQLERTRTVISLIISHTLPCANGNKLHLVMEFCLPLLPLEWTSKIAGSFISLVFLLMCCKKKKFHFLSTMGEVSLYLKMEDPSACLT